MSETESGRVREELREPLTAELIHRKAAEGWRPVAIEWERTPAGAAAAEGLHEVPYGMRVAPDHEHLEDNPNEVRVLLAMLEGIVEDQPMSRISADLNRRGWRTRSGLPWTQTAVFEMLPRLIDSSPELFQKEEWRSRTRAAVSSGAAPSFRDF